MSKKYKEMDLLELKAESLRLRNILSNKPKPNEYKQAKASLNTINNLICRKVAQAL